MRHHRSLPRRRPAVLLVSLAFALGATACGSDDDGLTDERGDLNEDFDSVSGATVDSPALSETTEPPDGVVPFGTVSIQGEVYPVDAVAADGGDFVACEIDPPDRPGFVDVTATLDERTFNFNVTQDVALVTLGADSTEVDDYAVEAESSTVRGSAEFDAGTVTFDITC